MEGTPLNKLIQNHRAIASMCSPALFSLQGKGDPTYPGREHAVTPTYGLKHLQKYVASRSITDAQSQVTRGG